MVIMNLAVHGRPSGYRTAPTEATRALSARSELQI